MLWYKGWLETRFRLLFILGLMGLQVFFVHSSGTIAPAPGARSPLAGIVLFSNPAFLVMICAMLAGAGIATQPPLPEDEGSSRFDVVHDLSSSESIPFVGSPSRSWMVGNGGRDWDFLLCDVVRIVTD